MKTRRLETALDSGSVFSSSAQANGFVSRIIVSNDGPWSGVEISHVRGLGSEAHLLLCPQSDQSHR